MEKNKKEESVLPPKRVSCITISSDASFHPIHKIGGWAFDIVCDGFRVRKAGVFKSSPNTITEAEMMAIGNAINELLLTPNLPKSKWLVVNTDCVPAINAIIGTGKQGAVSRRVKTLWKNLILTLGSEENHFRHVRAHTGADDGRSKVNHACDKAAKKMMRNAVKKFKNENSASERKP